MQSPILARSPSTPKPSLWRDELRQAFRQPGPLLDFLGLSRAQLSLPDAQPFPMLVPRAFAARMEQGRADDPLLRQVLPDPGELESVPGFVADPVGDAASRRHRGLLHKYHGRVLLITTGACAVHCRYCFRQSYPYASDHFDEAGLDHLIEYLLEHPEVEEVILSGGDPLMLDTRRLQGLTDRLRAVGSLRRLRLHTRLPIVLPSRIDEELLAWLQSLPWSTVVVVHANHAREFDADVDRAMARLRGAGAVLFNQSVLLRGVNDDEQAMIALMQRSFEAGVVPYYLHLLDRVEGAARFECDRRTALRLLDVMRRRLSGYLVPRLVREEAGAPYKLPVL
ncbi:EF-P beta-lysylation protein EpmB [Wenzhouxiangella marina]|uniref:L-lysine 2,3-aminomutase n=1 Tax=Wenzhouxiangella marina TaxID=1579979 RepID=A0A0K0XWR9_9GAMM|nr:EF-P beta-lysylation protein EpmB [Wenzhouxiangella marina]AKS42077.1 Lysine 2,3-aminomutase [Wenzhouxiangella marina]